MKISYEVINTFYDLSKKKLFYMSLDISSKKDSNNWYSKIHNSSFIIQ